MLQNAFTIQRASALREGVRLVRKVLRENQFPDGVTTRDLYKLAVQQPPPPNFQSYVHPNDKRALPAHPEHPVRSIAFLKRDILVALSGQNELHKVVRKPKTTPDSAVAQTKSKAFVWMVGPKSTRPPPSPPPPKEVVGTEVGVGADWSHLNKRRRAARVGKITLAVNRMRAKAAVPAVKAHNIETTRIAQLEQAKQQSEKMALKHARQAAQDANSKAKFEARQARIAQQKKEQRQARIAASASRETQTA